MSIHDGVEDLTFVLWWHGVGPWQTGTLPPEDPMNAHMDGSHHLLRALVSDDEAVAFLSEYYETDIPEDALKPIPPGKAIDPTALADLPNLRALEAIAEELSAFGIRLDRRP